MHIAKIEYQGNPNIGLFVYTNNKFCLVPHAMSEKIRNEIEEALGVPSYPMKAAGTDLLGVFFAGTDDMLFVPSIMFDHELDALTKLDIPFTVIPTTLTALGNNVFIHKNTLFYHPEMEKEAVKAFKIKNTKEAMIGELPTVGSLIAGNDKGLLISPVAKDFEVKFYSDLLDLPVEKGSTNFGTNYIRSGIVCNNHGFLVGSQSTGVEINTADEVFGFLE